MGTADTPAAPIQGLIFFSPGRNRLMNLANITPPAVLKEEKPQRPTELDPEAVTFFENAINSKEQPVAFFAMEWCEFCWSVRKLFAKCKIPYLSVDLDSAQYQKDNQGGKIRAALSAKSGSKTIPQIFVGDEFIGGCTELFDAYKDLSFQIYLKKYGVIFDDEIKIDPYSLLPGWLQPR